ncbi:MAG TPA: hypothetical protein VFF65_03815 [Phycisphaerales bacterium]|nr:hypothetical protein [Phycisphaerales bacterium]
MSGVPAHPEVSHCRRCGFDIRDRSEEYLLCPECGAANNRELARRDQLQGGKLSVPRLLVTVACCLAIAACCHYVASVVTSPARFPQARAFVAILQGCLIYAAALAGVRRAVILLPRGWSDRVLYLIAGGVTVISYAIAGFVVHPLR